jgi:flagellar hook-associated protein 1 FlgK
LIQYQKAYSAACRLMTVVDEALDKLINGTGVVGL